MRRVFYPARPADVIWGFVSFALMASLLGFLVYGVLVGHAGGVGIAVVKLAPLAFLGLSRMLYRQRVVLDLRRRTLTAEKWFFLIPLGREIFPVSEVAAVNWMLAEHGFELTLLRQGGASYVLAKADQPDEALEKELQAQLGCS